MGYFDGLTDAVFKKDVSGNTLFYPWGIFGSGFIIESEERKNQIRGFFKKMYMIMLPTIIIIQSVVGFWPNLLLFPVYCGWYFFKANQITNGLQRTEEKLTISESCKNSAKSHNLLTLVLLEISSLTFVAIGIWLLHREQNPFIAFASIGFFGLCSIVIGYMIFAKIGNK